VAIGKGIKVSYEFLVFISQMEKKLRVLILSIIAMSFVIASNAYACPANTHPVCTYDGSGRSVCHCVP
jgi:hypothetical protein